MWYTCFSLRKSIKDKRLNKQKDIIGYSETLIVNNKGL